jgi:imidazolonepropionase-like amidohydrolase
MEGEFGTIRVGARADLVLTDADPLADVSSLARPRVVVLRGEWLPRERLEGLVNEALAARGAQSR